ncbi:MAG: Sec-independent protein translocase protein TatB [Allorhizobium sp.]
MLDIGWTELLVIAVVLIVVVGPKDLPPMLRAFGKMTTRLRKTAGEFRSQFDEALREADMDDVRKTIGDVQRLNPSNALREAMNPLRQMGNDIKADLKKATTPDTFPPDPNVVKPIGETAVPMTSADLPPLATMPEDLAPVLSSVQPVVATEATVLPVAKAPPKPAAKPRVTTASTAASAGNTSAPVVAQKSVAEKAPRAVSVAAKKVTAAKPDATKISVPATKPAPAAKKTAATTKPRAAVKKDKA